MCGFRGAGQHHPDCWFFTVTDESVCFFVVGTVENQVEARLLEQLLSSAVCLLYFFFGDYLLGYTTLVRDSHEIIPKTAERR